MLVELVLPPPDRGSAGVLMNESALTDFQQDVVRSFFLIPQSDAYLLAGGVALIVSELTTRPTLIAAA